MIKVLQERPEHIDTISSLTIKAFPSNAEANLIDKLREKLTNFYSFVAIKDGEVIGHILFTPVYLDGPENNISIFGLGPMAVLPKYQKSGVGSKLVRRSLKFLKKQEIDAVVVLGHKEYYSKFGFESSAKYGVKSEFDVPDDVFMIKFLNRDFKSILKGTIKYDELFSKV
ncbi:N-acetyltransferase [Gracilimonas sp.]|uniref:GNAT family N-acetyltransferase n=1 Tax=Gracilimonas sp. TaxID=1974203 RepID=UPI0032EAEB6A